MSLSGVTATSPIPPWNKQTNVLLPLVTVIVTSFNYADFVPLAIRSVARQSYPRLECIIVDDRSTDHSRAAIEQELASLDRPNFSAVFLKHNSGQLAAMAAGLARARGVFVNFLDADDMLMDNFIAAHVRAHLNTSFSGSVSASDTVQIDSEGQILEGTCHFFWKSRGESLSNSPAYYHDLKQATRVIPSAALPSLGLEESDSTRSPAKALFYIAREYRGWPVVATSSFVFRRNVVALSIPKDTDPGRICADYYLYRLAHSVGGTICVPHAHSFYRFHARNAFAVNPVVGGPYHYGAVTPVTEKRLDELVARHLLGDQVTWMRLIGPIQFANLVHRGLFDGISS